MATITPTLKNKTQKSAFNKGASENQPIKKEWPAKKLVLIGTPLILIAGFLWVQSTLIPPKGNNLYGLCRGYIELQLQFPQTFKIIQFEERIPETEDPKNPQRLNQEVTFSSIDGFGSRGLHTITCGFKFNSELANTPWQGIFLERVLYDGRADHGWADVYYAPNDPRAAQDTNKRLEKFFNAIPSLLQNPPDLTLPMYNLNRMNMKDLQDL